MQGFRPPPSDSSVDGNFAIRTNNGGTRAATTTTTTTTTTALNANGNVTTTANADAEADAADVAVAVAVAVPVRVPVSLTATTPSSGEQRFYDAGGAHSPWSRPSTRKRSHSQPQPPSRASSSPSAPTPSPSYFPGSQYHQPQTQPQPRTQPQNGVRLARLPRTSSLLPPPHIASASLAHHAGTQLQPLVARPSVSVTAAGSQQQRWSASTGSSRSNSVSVSASRNSPVSRPPPGRRTSSFDSTFLFTDSSPAAKQRSPPRKLQKARRPSAPPDHLAQLAQVQPQPRLSSVGSKSPYIGLPAIKLLPSLEQSVHSNLSALHPPDDDDDGDTNGGISPNEPVVGQASYPQPSSRPAVAVTSNQSTAMQYDETQEQRPRGHVRSRSGRGSIDSTKSRSTKPPSQKAMLSRALQQANTAVQLDNAQDFEGARQAYVEACGLLQQVLQRTSADEDKRKLEAIRRTYTSRITELDQMLPRMALDTKALPAYPDSQIEAPIPNSHLAQDLDMDTAVQETSSVRKIVRNDSRSPLPITPNTSSQYWNQDGRAGAVTPQGILQPSLPIHTSDARFLQSSFSRSPVRSRFPDNALRAPPASSQTAMHVSAKSLQSQRSTNARAQSPEPAPSRSDYSPPPDPRSESQRTGERGGHESHNSWLDPIDESGGSSASSVHSRTSSLGYRRRHIRSTSGDTEAEFDTALDAAIEAAYDDGYEPMDDDEYSYREPGEEIVANALRKVELARERVRQTEREAYEVASAQQKLRQLRHIDVHPRNDHYGHEGFLDDNSSDEEERILDEVIRDVTSEDRSLSRQQPRRGPPSSIPRESDSSGYTNRTWQSSMGSNTQASNTPLSTVTESVIFSGISPSSAPTMPPPSHALPEPPPPRPSSAAQTVRNRRLSGQQHKQLKIETARLTAPVSNFDASSAEAKSTAAKESEADTSLGESVKDKALPPRPMSPPAEVSPVDPRPLDSPFEPHGHGDVDESQASRSASPSVNKIRKNFSSSSLRSAKSRNMSVSHPDEADMSPGTPSSIHWNSSRPPAVPALPTPLATTFREKSDAFPGGLGILDDSFHSPNSPGSPNPASMDAPAPLEPCPTDFMLRPFWLMRCLYQTLVHPRGGYLSSKLFIPSGAWRVKGVKLKGVEDKVANCDFLTAALLKLARVDTCDADAMLEEMQSIENVMEQIQISLGRKLGNEVGVQSAVALFRDASGGMDEPQSALPRSASVSGKSSSFSWRRLRSKNSMAALSSSTQQSRAAIGDASREASGLATLPMTAQPTRRPAKRDMSQVQFTGPNAHYMGSLARLFDAAQVIDQIARQVEDPGLRHADKTQVGLELCTRHAAEFFGFYICRFVLSDLGMMMDKFIKRGTEWVLA